MTDTVEVYKAPDGWRWRRRSQGNHEIISQGEAYDSKTGAMQGALRANPDVGSAYSLPIESFLDPS